MKNLKNKLGLFCILLTCMFFASCGSESVRISKDDPFIIDKITLVNEMYIYERGSFKRPFKELFATSTQSITVDYNLNLQVGDTLIIPIN